MRSTRPNRKGNRMYERDLKKETDWRIRVLRRTASECAAKAERLEGLRDALAPHRLTVAEIDRVLRRVDGLLDWRYVDALGELRLDPDALSDAMDVEALSTVRMCLAEALGRRKASE